MGKKAREYKAGDFIFAKVKGYPAWPARVRGINGKKYFVYFYGTGEIANLPPNMIFDYAENKSKFLTKTVKRKDFNDGVRQIEHDFLNNVPLEEVAGLTPIEIPAPTTNDVSNDTINADDTMNETTETSTSDEPMNTSQNETAVEDSDEGGALVIDEGKKGRKAKGESTPKVVKTVKELKAMKNQKNVAKKDEKEKEEEMKKEEEIISRSGRKIRPKRYADEQTEDNTALPTPTAKKRRGASPEKKTDTPVAVPEPPVAKTYRAVSQMEIEDLKEPFTLPEEDKEALLIAYLPTGRYVGIKVFQSRPATTKNDVSKLQWDRQAALNAIKLKKELEKGEITVQSVIHQLETELNLTDEDKANLDKERSIEERKVRMHFLKTEIEMVELDAKIKTCLSLEKADTDNCLVLLDQLQELPIKSLMLLKHPSVLESVKRMRCYVGNTVSWALNEEDSLVFSKKAQLIRKKADAVYNKFKDLFTVPEGLPFWEFFSERTMQFKKCTAKLEPVELCQLVHEPLEMTTPTSHTMRSAIDAANEVEPPVDDDLDKKKNSTPVKRKTSQSVVSTPNKTSKRKQKKQDEENDALAEEKSSEEANTEEDTKNDANISNKPADNNSESTDKDGSVGDKNEEPKAKRGRESTRKTDPSTPKSPTKRKTKS